MYLGTSPCDPNVADMLDGRRLGLMCQPGSNRPKAGWIWAADNGCFNAATWNHRRWLTWLNTDMPRSGCLFATVPDVVADHDATLARFIIHAHEVAAARYPIAFVGQNGATIANIPWSDIDCLFVGGTTEWKMSATAFDLAEQARTIGKWVHVGRVNRARRFAAWSHAADSADGTYLAFGPTTNAPKVAAWLDAHWANPRLAFT